MELFKSSSYILGLLTLLSLIFIASCNDPEKLVVRHKQPYGAYLTNRHGRTLYMFMKDTENKSKCYNQCAKDWPPFSTELGEVIPGDSVDETPLNTIKRNDGIIQVTYYGHPLYYYKGDTEIGDTKGQGKKAYGAEWYLVKPNGKKVDGKK